MSTRRVSLAVALLLPFLFGCSADHVPTGPDGLGEVAPINATQASSEAATLVGPAGGTLHVQGTVLSIPAGALAEPIWITMVRNGDGSVELGPHGQCFGVPVSLRFLLPMGNPSQDFAVEWFDPSAGVWVVIPSAEDGLGRTAPLEHFSLYRMTMHR